MMSMSFTANWFKSSNRDEIIDGIFLRKKKTKSTLAFNCTKHLIFSGIYRKEKKLYMSQDHMICSMEAMLTSSRLA